MEISDILKLYESVKCLDYFFEDWCDRHKVSKDIQKRIEEKAGWAFFEDAEDFTDKEIIIKYLKLIKEIKTD